MSSDDAGDDIAGAAREYGRPALRRQVVCESGAEYALRATKQGTAGGQAQQAGLDERLDDVGLARGQLRETVMGLQLPEEQLDFPSQRVGACDIVRIELVRGNVGQVHVIVTTVVTNASSAAECPVCVPNAAIRASLDVQDDLKVENGSLGGAEHRLQSLANHGDGAAAAGVVAIHDDGVDALLCPHDEEAAERVDPRQQSVVKVAEVDDE